MDNNTAESYGTNEELFQPCELLDKLEPLRAEYPELDLERLASDELFTDFIKGREENYSELYADYTELMAKAESRIKEQLRRRVTGSSGTAPSSGYGLSRAQLDSLEEWNSSNPEYAMTAREYAKSLSKLSLTK